MLRPPNQAQRMLKEKAQLDHPHFPTCSVRGTVFSTQEGASPSLGHAASGTEPRPIDTYAAPGTERLMIPGSGSEDDVGYVENPYAGYGHRVDSQ